MDKVKITIDGQSIEVEKGKTVLEAALDNGIYIPHLCYHPDLKPAGMCRLCMIEIEGKGVVTSCTTTVEDGMIIKTDSTEAKQIQKVSLELLLTNHPFDCLTCEQNTECELQKITHFIGVDHDKINNLRKFEKRYEIDDSNPFFTYDPNLCVLCGICVRTCDEIVGINNIDFSQRGFDTIVTTFKNKPFIESRCASCGECVVRCPVGALRPKKRVVPIKKVKTTCVYCGVGCGLELEVRGNNITGVTGDRDNPINQGQLCVKGRFGFEFINSKERLKTPLIKRNGKFEEATWDEALDLIAEKFSQHKGDSFAALSSAKATNEDNYVIQKFVRAVMKTNNIDHCARLCHAPTVAGLAQSFGSGAMTNSINEIENAGSIFAIGTNTTFAHPVISFKMKRAVKNGTKLIVANPKEIELCEYADIFLQHVPGSDVALMMGMARIIYEEGWWDKEFVKEHTENFDEFIKSFENFDLKFVEKITGVPIDLIKAAAEIYANNRPSMIFYAMGITQHSHGTDNVLATSNLALLTGNVGKESSGVNPLRGQNNVQGACDMGALPNVYSGYQKVTDQKAREKFEKAWGVTLPDKPGVTHTEIFDGILDGKIKVLYQVGENPVISEANASHVMEAIEKLDFFVAQDIFLTDTAKYADVVLPATTFAEKDGTFTNTERRVQRVRKAINPVGSSMPDWKIVCEIANRMGAKGFDYNSPEDIMKEVAELTPSYGGITYNRIEKVGLQWPCPTPDHPGTKYLHKDGIFNTPSKKGVFKPLKYKAPYELADAEYPLLLTTDRSLYHFHTGTMTRKGGLNIIHGEELINVNPEDAKRYNLKEGEKIKVISRRGTVQAKIKITDKIQKGLISMTFHFSESPTNILTSAAIDPVSKIPETKVCAVRIEKTKG